MPLVRMMRIIQCLAVKINHFFHGKNSSGRMGLTRGVILVKGLHKSKRLRAVFVGALPP